MSPCKNTWSVCVLRVSVCLWGWVLWVKRWVTCWRGAIAAFCPAHPTRGHLSFLLRPVLSGTASVLSTIVLALRTAAPMLSILLELSTIAPELNTAEPALSVIAPVLSTALPVLSVVFSDKRSYSWFKGSSWELAYQLPGVWERLPHYLASITVLLGFSDGPMPTFPRARTLEASKRNQVCPGCHDRVLLSLPPSLLASPLQPQARGGPVHTYRPAPTDHAYH
jgi:hypothetical protein